MSFIGWENPHTKAENLCKENQVLNMNSSIFFTKKAKENRANIIIASPECGKINTVFGFWEGQTFTHVIGYVVYLP